MKNEKPWYVPFNWPYVNTMVANPYQTAPEGQYSLQYRLSIVHKHDICHEWLQQRVKAIYWVTGALVVAVRFQVSVQ